MVFTEKAAKGRSSSYLRGWTPPGSPTMGLATSQVTIEDLKHLLVDMLEKVLSDLTTAEPECDRAAGSRSGDCNPPPNTPVPQLDYFQPAPDMVQLKRLLLGLVPARGCPADRPMDEPIGLTGLPESGTAGIKRQDNAEHGGNLPVSRPDLQETLENPYILHSERMAKAEEPESLIIVDDPRSFVKWAFAGRLGVSSQNDQLPISGKLPPHVDATVLARSSMINSESQGDSRAPAEPITPGQLVKSISLGNGLIDATQPPSLEENSQQIIQSRVSRFEFKTVMETWDKETCKYKIVEPVEAGDNVDNHDKYSFIVRERVDRKSREVTSYIDVISEWLRDILREVLHGIKAVSVMKDKPSIEQNVLFHFIPELEKYAEYMKNGSNCDAGRLEHLGLLLDHVKHIHASISQRLDSMLQHGHITYDLLWALFKPGSYVYAKCFGTGEPRCVVFDAGEETTEDEVTYYKLECRYLDYDGQKFGEAGIFLGVAKFRGSKPIETLQAFPFHYHPDHDHVREDLVKRGQKFRDLAGTHFQHCEGNAFFMKNGKPIEMKINSRVGVDAALFRDMQPNYCRPRLHDIWASDNGGRAVIDIDALFKRDREREKEKMQKGSVEAQQMREDEFLICCPTVCCFSFQEKRFLECAVGALRDVKCTPESFDCLKIPSETKTLLSSLAKTRLGLIPTVPFDDVIDGKGRGLNILLHGPPGVGKTFTVEATSELFELPLYSISAGELAVNHGDSNELEQQLDSIFKIAKYFNAVLLLDEADAFMERRTSYHDTHNRLVTVFLRKLEYYQGILFLTSNRGIGFDDAIMSRIHLVIEYENLTTEFRREIWANFLSKAQTIQGPAIIEDSDLKRLECLALNGREIKNLAAIAHALATVDATRVSYKYLELAAESNKKFSGAFGRQSHVEGMYV